MLRLMLPSVSTGFDFEVSQASLNYGMTSDLWCNCDLLIVRQYTLALLLEIAQILGKQLEITTLVDFPTHKFGNCLDRALKNPTYQSMVSFKTHYTRSSFTEYSLHGLSQEFYQGGAWRRILFKLIDHSSWMHWEIGKSHFLYYMVQLVH